MKHPSTFRILLGALALAGGLLACSAAPDDGSLGSEDIVAAEDGALASENLLAPRARGTFGPIDVPIRPRLPLPQNRCVATDVCSTTRTVYGPTAWLDRPLAALGCGTPSKYENPAQGLPERRVARCPDNAQVRELVASTANSIYTPSLSLVSCGICLPPLRTGEIYVFWSSWAMHPNCPNNCGDGDGNTDMAISDYQAP